MRQFVCGNQESSIYQPLTCSKSAKYIVQVVLNAYSESMSLLTSKDFEIYLKVNKAVKVTLEKEKDKFNVFSKQLNLNVGMSIEPFFVSKDSAQYDCLGFYLYK